MAIAIRLSRGGSKQRPYYRVVVADTRSPRDGKYLEQVGTYNPMLGREDPKRVTFDTERAKHWLKMGATPSDRVAYFFSKCLHIPDYYFETPGYRTRRSAEFAIKTGQPGEIAKIATLEKNWDTLVDTGMIIAGSPATSA